MFVHIGFDSTRLACRLGLPSSSSSSGTMAVRASAMLCNMRSAAFMVSCCGVGSWLDMAANVATRPPSIDRIVSTTGFKDCSLPLRYHMCRRLSRAGHSYKHGKGRRHICNSAEPDWDAEMSLFRKRSMKPNQMQTIRRLEEEVDIGKVTLLKSMAAGTVYHIKLRTVMSSCVKQVLFSDDGLAILEGLNNDAPVGASLRFVSGASGSELHTSA